MFTRAVITDEISQDLNLAARMAHEFGLDQLEIRTAWDVRIDQMGPQELARVRAIADRYGLGIVCLASPFLKCDLGNAAEYQEHLQLRGRGDHVNLRYWPRTSDFGLRTSDFGLRTSDFGQAPRRRRVQSSQSRWNCGHGVAGTRAKHSSPRRGGGG